MEHFHTYTVILMILSIGVLTFWLRSVTRQLETVIDKHNNLALMLGMIVQQITEEEEDDE